MLGVRRSDLGFGMDNSIATHLSLVCKAYVFGIIRIDTIVVKFVLWPTDRGTVKLLEPRSLELIADDRYVLRVSPRVFLESCNGKQQVLERVQSKILSRQVSRDALRRRGISRKS
jgi:hypothetical protein